MKTNRRWVICAVAGVLIAPILYVLIQGVWAFTLGELMGYARRFSEHAGRLYLYLHSAIGAFIAAAIVGFPLGRIARTSPILLGSIVSGTVAAYLVFITYDSNNFETLIYLSKELPAFILFSIFFSLIGARSYTRWANSTIPAEEKNEPNQ